MKLKYCIQSMQVLVKNEDVKEKTKKDQIVRANLPLHVYTNFFWLKGCWEYVKGSAKEENYTMMKINMNNKIENSSNKTTASSYKAAEFLYFLIHLTLSETKAMCLKDAFYKWIFSLNKLPVRTTGLFLFA